MSEIYMDSWNQFHISDVITSIETGVSVNSENRTKGTNEIGILKTSCIAQGRFMPQEHKAVLLSEKNRVKLSVKADSILMSRMNTPNLVGEIGYSVHEERDLFLPDRLWMFRGKPNISHTKFLSYLLSSASFRQKLYDIATGTSGSMKNIAKKSFLQIQIGLPPISEQKKIAEILSTIDRAISIRTKYSNSIAQSTRFIADEIFQKANINYKSIKIGDCTKRLWQGINTAADKVHYYETGVPILQAKHITTGEIQMDGSRKICDQDYSRYKERYQPHIGDILFTTIGTIGKSALIEKQTKLLVAWNIFLISPIEKIISGEYLYYFLQVLDRRDYFHEHAAGNATKFINKTLISELEVPLPPLEEQTRICRQIRAMKNAEYSSRNLLSKHIELKKALSHDLLSGHKRVNV